VGATCLSEHLEGAGVRQTWRVRTPGTARAARSDRTRRARGRAHAPHARARARAAPAPAPGARTRGARAHARAPPPRAARARTRARVRTARFNGTHAPGPVFPVLPLTVSSSRRRRMTVGHRLASLPRRARLMHIRGRRARSGSGARRGVRLYGNGRAGPAPRRAPRVTPGSRRVFAAPGAPGTRHAAAQAPSQTDVV